MRDMCRGAPAERADACRPARDQAGAGGDPLRVRPELGSGRAELELGALRAEERDLGRLAELDLLDPAPPPARRVAWARTAALRAAQGKRRQQSLAAPFS